VSGRQLRAPRESKCSDCAQMTLLGEGPNEPRESQPRLTGPPLPPLTKGGRTRGPVCLSRDHRACWVAELIRHQNYIARRSNDTLR
jgi:hypothetical protein